MDYLDLIYIALFALLYKSKHTRLASIVFVLCYALFLILHNALPNGYTYVASGSAHLIIFLFLVAKKSKTYFLVSILSVCLVFVNIQGYMDYENGVAPDSYNHVYFLFLNTQLALLYLRALINGLVDRFNFKRGLVQFIINSNIETFGEVNKREERK